MRRQLKINDKNERRLYDTSAKCGNNCQKWFAED